MHQVQILNVLYDDRNSFSTAFKTMGAKGGMSAVVRLACLCTTCVGIKCLYISL